MQGILSKLRSWELDHKRDDIRGWLVRDKQGNSYGRVAELVIDTDQKHVTELVLADGRRLPARDISIGDHELFVEPEAAESTAASSAPLDTASAEAPAEIETRAPSSREGSRFEAEGEDVVVAAIEEDVEFGKRRFEKGTTRVQVRVFERPFEQSLHLREEVVNVERRKLDEPLELDEAEARLQDGTVEVTAIKEYPVTEKHARVVEEVVLAKKIEERAERLRETVRRSAIDVVEIPSAAYESNMGARP